MADVRYCTTEDGARIAYSVEGQGPPLVVTPYFFFDSLTDADEGISVWKTMMDGLRAGRQVIRFDFRSTGLSQRDAGDLKQEASVLDLEAVVQAAGLKRFALLGWVMGGPTAVDYAARHPRNVDRLILYATWARALDTMPEDNLRSLASLSRSDWTLASQIFADMSARKEAPDLGIELAESMRSNVSGNVAASWLDQADLDLTDLLSKVKAPTLILHRVNDTAVAFATSQRLASGIPNARLVPLQGSINYPALGDTQAIIDAINSFLSEEKRPAAEPRAAEEPAAPSAFRTVLFTDVVGHTEMMRRLGDENGRDVLREHERITREVLKAHGGAEVKTMGDGFMAAFSSVTKAVECAIALQRAFGARNADVGAALAPPQGAASGAPTSLEPLHIRIGLNAGEPIEEDGDLFGETVILAARIAAQAQGGEILSSMAVRELCAGKGFLFADRGEHVLRGFEDPVRVFEISARE